MRTLEDYQTFLANLKKYAEEAEKKPQKNVSATQAVELKNTKPCK